MVAGEIIPSLQWLHQRAGSRRLAIVSLGRGRHRVQAVRKLDLTWSQCCAEHESQKQIPCSVLVCPLSAVADMVGYPLWAAMGHNLPSWPYQRHGNWNSLGFARGQSMKFPHRQFLHMAAGAAVLPPALAFEGTRPIALSDRGVVTAIAV